MNSQRLRIHAAVAEIEETTLDHYRIVAQRAMEDAILAEGYNNIPRVDTVARTIQKAVLAATAHVREAIVTPDEVN